MAALAGARSRRGSAARRAFLDATGVSDGRYFADDGIEIINFGVVVPSQAPTAKKVRGALLVDFGIESARRSAR